jgi:hypothetical protein
VNELNDWPADYGRTEQYLWGSYRQDLWYLALKRSKLDTYHNVQPYNRLARYTKYYTPKHYLALCYLDDWVSWEEAPFEIQIQTVLLEHPFSEDEERIQREMESLWERHEWEGDSGCTLEERTQLRMEILRMREGESDFVWCLEEDEESME